MSLLCLLMVGGNIINFKIIIKIYYYYIRNSMKNDIAQSLGS